MPCDYNPELQARLSMERDKAERDRLVAQAKKAKAEAIKKLEGYLNTGKVNVGKTAQGEIGFIGWNKADRLGFCDACAVNALKLKGSIAFISALARARTVSAVELAGGKH